MVRILTAARAKTEDGLRPRRAGERDLSAEGREIAPPGPRRGSRSRPLAHRAVSARIATVAGGTRGPSGESSARTVNRNRRRRSLQAPFTGDRGGLPLEADGEESRSAWLAAHVSSCAGSARPRAGQERPSRASRVGTLSSMAIAISRARARLRLFGLRPGLAWQPICRPRTGRPPVFAARRLRHSGRSAVSFSQCMVPFLIGTGRS